ncbi:MAG TPA: UDP-2,4-diacetamido-2,4,6-trideoxy-beta-L-altropyranose hydrolase [Arcobacter sp.]|nr:UDP-2,4-diacetamido-2,4,6-trideoxy-beta-L-altropyranose hydrolase [Arcobacter sp.]
MNVLFRADSSSTIGTGHIMRDLVLAEQYVNSNIIFATQNLSGNINHKIIEKNYNIEILNSNSCKELNILITTLDIDMLIIDHYGIDYDFEKKLKTNNPRLKIFVFDDTYERHYCDILLNHNVYGDSSKYKNLVPENCELRCGLKYTLLRDEFIIAKKIGRQNKKDKSNLDIFIAMGGADHSNVNTQILEVLKKFKNIHIHVVTTIANMHLESLKCYIENLENATLHINTNQISKLMNKADLAIITPSVTTNEILYLNIPFIAIKTANNQVYMHDYLRENNYMVSKSFNHIELFNYVKILLNNPSI